MSYILSPSGFANPANENLDMNGFDIDDADTINANTINGASATGLTIGSTASQKVGFYGETPIVQGGVINNPIVSPQPPSYSNVALDASFNELVTKMTDILDALRNIGIIST